MAKVVFNPIVFMVGALCGVGVYAIAAYGWPLISPYFTPTAYIGMTPH